MEKGKIILLNGVSSSGKTTLSKELVKRLPNYFHFSVDEFDYLIEQMEDRENNRLIHVPTEYYFHQNIKMFSDSGVNLIVDHVLHNKETLLDCLGTLKDYPVFFVGVHCPLVELENREKARGDRQIGLSRKQLNYVHNQKESYDIEVNTFENRSEECAKSVIKKLADVEQWAGWLTSINNINLTFEGKK